MLLILTKDKPTNTRRRINFRNGFALTVLFCLLFSGVQSQAPAFIPWQAIARDASGLAKTNSAVTVEFRIFNTMTDATPSYRETHQITTNDFGYFNLRIGAGTVVNGSFGTISWQTGDVSYEVWTDFGSGLTQLGGRAGFLSVPYALYAKAAPSPTLTINSPHTINSTTTGVYSVEIAQPSLTLNGYSLSLSNSNSVQLPGNFSAGNGIAINGNVISNTLPDQTVSISGTAVSGTYPSYTISQAPGTTLTAGNNIVLNGSAPAYTVSSVTPTLTASGNATLSGTWPVQNIAVPSQTLSQSGSTVSLSGGGGSVTLQQASVSAGNNVIVTGAAPDFTVSSVTPSLTATGNIALSGSYPSQTINIQPQVLSVSGNTLNLSGGGGSVSIQQSSLSAGNNVIVTGSSPNYTVSAATPSITGTGNIAVSGSYPSQTLNVLPQLLSVSGKTLNLSGGGGSVTIQQTNLNAGNNVIITGSAPDYTVGAVTPSITGTGNIAVSGSYPSQTLNVQPQLLSVSGQTLSLSQSGGTVSLPVPTINGGNNISVTTNSNTSQFTVSAVSQALSISGSTLFLSDGGGNVTLPVTSLSAGNNISLTGTAPAYTVSSPTPTFNTTGNVTVTGVWPTPNISVPSQTLSLSGNSLALSNGGGTVDLTNSSWGITGNGNTNATTNFIGTSNAVDLVVKTNAQERIRVTASGSVGIGVSVPTANFDVNYGTVRLGAGSDAFSQMQHGVITASIIATLGTNSYIFSAPGFLVGDTFVATLNDHTAGLGTIELYSIKISSNGSLTMVINSTNLLSQPVTLTLSYILYRP